MSKRSLSMSKSNLDWLNQLEKKGLVPYIATSESVLPALDLSFFGGKEVVRLLEDPEARNFHEAYLVSNSLAFGHPDIKMPNWVYIDCVLMQTAVIGFCMSVAVAPGSLVSLYERDPYVDISALDYIPVSGQIAALSMSGEDLTGFSLFSLRRQLETFDLPRLGILTKYAALKAYKADEKRRFYGLSQYDNAALRAHVRFAKDVYIDQPIMPLHPMREMSFMYSMAVSFDEKRIFGDLEDNSAEAEFMLRADDTTKKHDMLASIRDGQKFKILDPVHVRENGDLYLPIGVE